MNNQPQPDQTPREVITTALEDWWLTTDPVQSPSATEAACLAVAYLHGAGYTITPEGTQPMTRASIRASRAAALTSALLAGLFLLTTAYLLGQHDWLWATATTIGTCTLGHETYRDLTAHRQHRSPRPQKRRRI